MYIEQADLSLEVGVESEQGGERRVVGHVKQVVGETDGELESLRRRSAGDEVGERLHMQQDRVKALANDCRARRPIGEAIGNVGDGGEEAGWGDGEGRRPRSGHHVSSEERRLRVVAERLHGAS